MLQSDVCGQIGLSLLAAETAPVFPFIDDVDKTNIIKFIDRIYLYVLASKNTIESGLTHALLCP